MLELRTETFVTSINVPAEVRAVFPHPIIFYMAHKDDRRLIFTTFVILDLKKQEMQYIISYLPENIAAVETHPDEHLLRIPWKLHNPHSSIQVKEGVFITFVERSPFFYRVDQKKNKLLVYTFSDLQGMTMENISSLCCTVYKDDDDAQSFYLSAISSDGADCGALSLYRFSLDSLHPTLLQRIPGGYRSAPHVTRKFGNYLLNSEFDNITIVSHGKMFGSARAFLEFVYGDLYKKFCALYKIEFSKERFYANNIIKVLNVVLEDDFREFCNSRGKNFLEICRNDDAYAFQVSPGKISVYNMRTGEFNKYETTLCAPAHFEIDEEAHTIYVSSHNFAYFDHHYYLGPAAIDKFLFNDGKLYKQGTFSRHDGYRFTTHKFFRYMGKSYVCMFGQPNRLFFINADTMELEYFDDIGHSFLSHCDDIFSYVNSGNLETITIKTMMVSSDGKYIFILSYQCMYIYSFPERKIVAQMPYWGDVQLKDGINLGDFYKRTTHLDYLT